MMTWQIHRVAWQLLTPLHSGARKLGNIQQTRPYVPGRSIWGALTASLVRLSGEKTGKVYAETGKWVDENLAFTYLYPTANSDNVNLWPWGNSEENFEGTFLGSYSNVALADGRRAEDASLHETEYIAPFTYSGEQVFLVGYIFSNSVENPLDWQQALKYIQFGGERRYGWGKVKLVSLTPVTESNCFDAYKFILDKLRPRLRTIQDQTALLGHVRVETTASAGSFVVKGSIEPLVGLETDPHEGGFGGRTSRVEVCWTPGSRVNSATIFSIEEKGIWKYQPG